jgi:omega-amidase
MSSLTISIIQPDLKWENRDANLLMLEEKINKLPFTELVVLPEMFSTGFSMRPEILSEKMDGQALQWMQRVASKKKIILTGSLIIEENGSYFNRLIWMLPNGQCGYYDKRHLFGYAGEHEHYSSGNKRLIASVKGWKINLQVCYDLRFPIWARQGRKAIATEAENSQIKDNRPDEDNSRMKDVRPEELYSPEYDILVYVANWPERRAHAWKTLLQARAIENQCYVVGVNRVGRDGNEINHVGDSMIIDPMGEPLVHLQHDVDVYTLTLEKKNLEELRGKLPFLKDGDSFQIM